MPLVPLAGQSHGEVMALALLRFAPLVATIALACSAPAVRGGSAASATNTTIIARPALWAISDSDTTLYLFGTVHILKPQVRWFDGYVKRAFDQSDTLVVEVVQDNPAALGEIVTRLGLNSGGPALITTLTPADATRYSAALKTYDLPQEVMDRLDPWLVAINLSVVPLERLGYKKELAADAVLEASARQQGKAIIGLETAEQQLGFFDSLPRDVQIKFLTSTLEELPNSEREFATLMHNWAHGKADALAHQMNESLETTPELAKPLLLDRNARWVRWIEQRMEQPGTVFVGVGAGHLAGKGSVIDLLKSARWKVHRVSDKNFPLR